MSQQPASHRGAYSRLLEKVKTGYEARGFTVSFDEPLPPPNDDFVACAIARRDDKTILIEFQPANIFKARRKRLHRLNEVMESIPDWQLDIATYPVDSPPPDPSRDDIFRRIEEAKRVATTSPEAAFMLIWSATEGALLALCRDQDIPKMRPSQPRTLVHDLSIHGVISDNLSSELDLFARVRDSIAHGLKADLPSEDQMDWLTRFTLAAAEDEVPTIEAMTDWHDSEHGVQSPTEAGCDIGSLLRQRFDTALEDDIAEAVALIESGRTEAGLRLEPWELEPDPEQRRLLRYGARRSKELGIRPEVVAALIEDYKIEAASTRT